MKSKSRIDKTKYKFDINEYNSKFWYKNDQLHRDNNKPAIIYSNGYMSWYTDGEFIRSSRK